MKKIVSIFIISIIYLSPSIAQKSFELPIPQEKVNNSNYNKIDFLDSRIYKQDLGFVYTTTFRKRTLIEDKVPISTQLNSLMTNITDDSAKDQTMLFQLRDLMFSQGAKSNSPIYCHIRVNLYQRFNDEYYYINRIDTLMIKDTYKAIIEEAASVITSFVVDNLTTLPLDEVYSLNDVYNIDNIEKSEIKLYATDAYQNGIYPDYYSFANQTPLTVEMTYKLKDKELKEVKVKDATDEKWVKMKPQDIYAVVVEGIPYIAAGKKYCILYKKDNNLEFKTEETSGLGITPSVSIGVGGGSGGGFVGGGIGITIFGSSKKEKITMYIDHLNGDFIAK